MRLAMLVTALALAAPAAALAANANHPYWNVDHRVDAGNDTGNSRVEQLNQAQLGGPTASRLAPAAPVGAAASPSGYIAYPPVVGYAPPAVYAPYAYYPPPYYVAYPRPWYFGRPFFFGRPGFYPY